MGEIIFWWILGFAISMGLGQLLTRKFLFKIRNDLIRFLTHDSEDKELEETALKLKNKETLGSLDWMVGFVERGLFTLIIAFDISGGAVAMMSWVLVKMVTNWNKFQKPELIYRGWAICSLMGSLVSMFFALIGGLFCRYGLGLICQ